MKPKKASLKRLAKKLNQLEHDNPRSHMLPIIKNEINQRTSVEVYQDIRCKKRDWRLVVQYWA